MSAANSTSHREVKRTVVNLRINSSSAFSYIAYECFFSFFLLTMTSRQSSKA